MPGRPSTFSQKTADAICERLIEGESLRAICLDKVMPDASTVCRWLAVEENEGFRQQYARAREAQADTIADEVLHISDTQVVGQKRTTKPDGTIEVVEADMIEHRRLRIDARKWYAGKLAPKKYGDKLDLNHSGNVEMTLAGKLEAARNRVGD